MPRTVGPESGAHAPAIAAIDIGTNSIHLVVARIVSPGRFEVIAREKEMVRLGRGASDMKHLADEAMDRAVDCLRRFRQIAEVSTSDIRAVATSATREATNQAEFLARCAHEAGVSIDVISGPEEARLVHLGITQAIDLGDRRALAIDIGGGSTEFAIGGRHGSTLNRSFKIGAIRLTERFFRDGTIRPERVEACRHHVRSFVAPVVREIDDEGFDLAVASSGTAGALAQAIALERGEPQAGNGFTMSRDELAAVAERIVETATAGRVSVPGIDERRADIIVAGAVLLDQLVTDLALDRLVYSDYAVREGVLADGAAMPLAPRRRVDLRRSGVEHVAQAFDPERAHREQVTSLALTLFDQLQGTGLHQESDVSAQLLEAGAMLCNVGRVVAHSAHHKHSAYIIRNTEHLRGFTRREIELIAQIARYHRKSSPKPKHVDHMALDVEDRRLVELCAGVLRIAIGLDRGHADRVIGLRCRLTETGLEIVAHTRPGTDASLELHTAAQRTPLLAARLGRPVVLVEERAAETGRRVDRLAPPISAETRRRP